MERMVRFVNMFMLGGVLFGLLLGVPPLWAAQANSSSASSFTPGYLGVYLRGGNAASHSRNPKGVEILGVDRDAPAGKVGLKPHDMIEAVNGQRVVSDAQLRRILHGMAAGRTIHLAISRDGSSKEFAVKLASRAEVEASAWPEGVIFADGFFFGGGGRGLGESLSGDSLGPDVRLREFVVLDCDGVDLEPIGRQLAGYFGVPLGSGLLVRKVAPHSDAWDAGLRVGDVITVANGMPSTTLRGWLMVVSQNQGKTVKLKVIRNHKEKLIEYTPGGHRQQGYLETPAWFREGPSGLPMGGADAPDARSEWSWAAMATGRRRNP